MSASSRLAPRAAGTARVAHACSLFLRKRVTLRRLFLAEARHRGRLSADDVARPFHRRLEFLHRAR